MVAVGDIKARMARSGISQTMLARRLGMSQGGLSQLFQGARPWPAGLEERMLAEVERLAAAEQAASEARDRVLAGTE